MRVAPRGDKSNINSAQIDINGHIRFYQHCVINNDHQRAINFNKARACIIDVNAMWIFVLEPSSTEEVVEKMSLSDTDRGQCVANSSITDDAIDPGYLV